MRISDWSSDVCSSDLKRHPARCGPCCADGIRALVLRRGDKRHGRNSALDRVEAIPDGLMPGPILSARQHNHGAAGGACFALFGCAGTTEVPRIDLRSGQDRKSDGWGKSVEGGVELGG